MTKEYLDLLEDVYLNGIDRSDRTGVGTRSVFGTKLEYNLFYGFPLLTTKKVHWKSVVYELLWFLKGDTNIKYLNDNGVTIWDEWADDDGELGPIYGAQWRRWQDGDVEYDQLYKVIHDLITYPMSRRHIVSAWNVPHLPIPGLSPKENAAEGMMALAPCHVMYQFYVETNGSLSLQVYQRSADLFLGVPFNIASYALLLSIVAKIIGSVPYKLIWIGGDTHIYSNHYMQVEEQLWREPRELPKLLINLPPYKKVDELFNKLDFNHFSIIGYKPHAPIKAPIAI